MFKAVAFSILSALAGVGITIQAVSTSVAVADNCRLYGYTHCRVVGNAEMPETSDPKLRAELTRLVRQLRRDKL